MLYNKVGDIMKIEKIKSFIRENVSVPLSLIKNYKYLKIDSDELVLVIYLISINNDPYNPKAISETMDCSMEKIMTMIDSLESKNIVVISSVKNDKGIFSELISLDPLYSKLASMAIADDGVEEESTLYEIFEKEFGRTLSPIEFEIINGWVDNKYDENLILHALKEAVYNGVNSFRYIDKILYTWDKKGLKTVEAIEKEVVKKNDDKVEVFDYNWLEDNE